MKQYAARGPLDCSGSTFVHRYSLARETVDDFSMIVLLEESVGVWSPSVSAWSATMTSEGGLLQSN